MKILFLLNFFVVQNSWAASAAHVVESLTSQTIVVRTGIDACTKLSLEESANAGAVLSRNYENEINSIDIRSFRSKEWLQQNKSSCIKECSCSVMAAIYKQFTAEISNKNPNVSKSLSKMTDADYKKCKKKRADICKSPEVQRLLQQIRQNGD